MQKGKAFVHSLSHWLEQTPIKFYLYENNKPSSSYQNSRQIRQWRVRGALHLQLGTCVRAVRSQLCVRRPHVQVGAAARAGQDKDIVLRCMLVHLPCSDGDQQQGACVGQLSYTGEFSN